MPTMRTLIILDECSPIGPAQSVPGGPPGTDDVPETNRVPAYFTADAGLSLRTLRNLDLLYRGTHRPPEGRLIIPATRDR